MVGQKHRGNRKPHADIVMWRLGKGKDGNKGKNMKRIIAIVCLAIAITANAIAQQAKDVTNNTSNMKSFKSTAWLLPQPVLIIGTYDKEGNPNAMNAAWGGQWDMNEIIISLGSHQTTDNLAVNPEFTVAFATAETMVASDYVGIVSGRNTPDKMEKTGWTIEKAPNVNAPIFKEFPMTLECRVKQKIDESETGYYLVAEIVNILCDEKYLADSPRLYPAWQDCRQGILRR